MIEIWSPNVTLEGDGFVLYQQTTKDILKQLAQMLKSKQPSGVYSYLNDILEFTQEPPKLKFEFNIKSLIDIIKASLLTQIVKTGELLKEKMVPRWTINGIKCIYLKWSTLQDSTRYISQPKRFTTNSARQASVMD